MASRRRHLAHCGQLVARAELVQAQRLLYLLRELQVRCDPRPAVEIEDDHAPLSIPLVKPLMY
jgi:hypothetical protein